jgi:hypothetical protein
MGMECHCGVAIGLGVTRRFVTPQISLVEALRPLSPFSPPFRLAYLTTLKFTVLTENAKKTLEDKNFACHRLAAITPACHCPPLIGYFASLPQV